jgi:hypothetical protein
MWCLWFRICSKSVRQPLPLYRVKTVGCCTYIFKWHYMHTTHTIKGKYNFIQPHTWTISLTIISKTNGENKNKNVIKNIFLAINVGIQSHDRNYCIYYFSFIADEIDECPFSLFIIYLHRIRALKPNGEGCVCGAQYNRMWSVLYVACG